MSSGSRPTSSARGLYLVVIFVAFALDVAFVFTFVVSPIDYCLTSREAIDYVDVSFVYVQLLAALFAAACGFCALSIALRPVYDARRKVEHSLAVLATCALAAASASGGLLGPSSEPRQHAIRWVFAAHIVAATLSAVRSLLLARQGGGKVPIALDEVETAPAFRAHFEDADGRPSLERLERFLEIRSVRGSIRAQLRRSNTALSTLGIVLCLVSLLNFSLELRRTLGADPPLLAPGEVAALNAPQPVEAYFGDLPLQFRGSARVVLLVISGLSRDALEAVPAWQRLLSSTEFARDSLTLSLAAGLPSTSMAQWLAFATGASPAITGVYGDRQLSEPPFDSIFRQARLHGLSSFATGSPWFTELFHSQLLRPYRFFAEGAVPPVYSTYDTLGGEGVVSGDAADRQRMQLLHRALSANQRTAESADFSSSVVDSTVNGSSRAALRARKAASLDRGGILSPAWEVAEDTVPPISRERVGVPRTGGYLFELLVAHLSAADAQSHCLGVSPSFDPRGAYVTALGAAAEHIEDLVLELDASTTLLIASDHGHVDRGGSGGSEAHSVDVPLIAYRAGSMLGLKAKEVPPAFSIRTTPRARRERPLEGVDGGVDGSVDEGRRAQHGGTSSRYGPGPLGVGWKTVDIAPTIAAVLGLPVPRQSEGVPISPLLPLANQPLLGLTARDVFIQRRKLAAAVAGTLQVPLSTAEADLLRAEPAPESATLVDATADLLGLHARLLHRASRADAEVASWLTTAGALALLIVLLTLLQRGSFADLSLAQRPLPGHYANRRALVVAVLGVLTYYCLAIGLFMGLLHVRGYTSWDSTVLHFPTEQVVYLLDGALPALVVAHLLSRTFHFAFLVTPDDEPTQSQPAAARTAARTADVDSESVYSDDDDRESADPTPSRQSRRTERRPEPPNRWNVSTFCARLGSVVSEYVRCLFLGHSPIYSDLSMIYLIKVYVLSFAIVTHLLLACVQVACDPRPPPTSPCLVAPPVARLSSPLRSPCPPFVQLLPCLASSSTIHTLAYPPLRLAGTCLHIHATSVASGEIRHRGHVDFPLPASHAAAHLALPPRGRQLRHPVVAEPRPR